MDKREKKELMARLERDAQRICAQFRLRYRVLEPERANVKRRYGVCFSDGTIRIRLFHVTTRKALKYSSLVNTLCHELAHLRHFNHGPRFQDFNAEILEWARRQGIYVPGTEPRERVRESLGSGATVGTSAKARNLYPTEAARGGASGRSSTKTLPRPAAKSPESSRKPPRAAKPLSPQLELFG